MGCGFSSHQKSAEIRCREREQWMKECVKNQHAYAAAHAAYLRSLKDTGAALRQFGDNQNDSNFATAAPLLLTDLAVPNSADMATSRFGKLQRNPSARKSLSYFPPPFPHFLLTPSSSSTPFFLRNHSPAAQKMHNLAKSFIPSLPRKLAFTEDNATIKPAELAITTSPSPPASVSSQWEEDLFNNVFPPHQGSPTVEAKCEQDDDSGRGTPGLKLDAKCEYEVQTPDNTESGKWRMLQVASSPSSTNGNCKGELAHGKIPPTDVHTLAYALRQLDDFFMDAYGSGRDVARLLEGQRTHYHQNPAGATGSLKHSSRVHRVMSWGRYTHTDGEYAITNGENDDVSCNGKETHASTLDKLLAWEKKLHEEVKVGEVIRIQLEKKSLQLKKQKKREEGSAIVSKTKASVKSLHTRYLVEIQAVDAASNEVEKLRDSFLHSQLVELVQQSMLMWKTMLACHQQQCRLIEDLKLDTSCAPAKTTDFHLKNTLQLECEFENWQRNLENLVATQKYYLNSMCKWLLLHIIEIESDGKRMPDSPEKMSSPPVYEFAKAWFEALKHINSDASLHAMKQFSNLIHELKLHQTEELKQKKKLDQLKKQLEKKEHALKVHMMKQEEKQSEGVLNITENSLTKAIEASVKLLKERVESEKDKYEKMCMKSGNMTLISLQKGLPPVLNAMKDFANNYCQHYTKLFFLTMPEGAPIQREPIPVLQITL